MTTPTVFQRTSKKAGGFGPAASILLGPPGSARSWPSGANTALSSSTAAARSALSDKSRLNSSWGQHPKTGGLVYRLGRTPLGDAADRTKALAGMNPSDPCSKASTGECTFISRTTSPCLKRRNPSIYEEPSDTANARERQNGACLHRISRP